MGAVNFLPPQGFHPRRHNRTPRVEIVRKKMVQYTRKNLDSQLFSPQRISGTARKPAKDL